MMKLVLAFYDRASEALYAGADIEKLVDLPVREKIGRYKYTPEDEIRSAYEETCAQLAEELAELTGKEAN